jgi:hypothetical protein
MKCKIALVSILFLTLALVVALPGAVAVDGPEGELGGGFGFGQRVAGTYFSPAGFGGTLTLHADGTVAAISGACCGSGANANIQSEAFGNWERSGTHQVTLRALIVGTQYDPAAQPLNNFVAVAMEVLDFDSDYESYTGTLCTALWFYDLGDPMPDVEVEEPLLTVGPFDVDGARLAVFQECPPPAR